MGGCAVRATKLAISLYTSPQNHQCSNRKQRMNNLLELVPFTLPSAAPTKQRQVALRKGFPKFSSIWHKGCINHKCWHSPCILGNVRGELGGLYGGLLDVGRLGSPRILMHSLASHRSYKPTVKAQAKKGVG